MAEIKGYFIWQNLKKKLKKSKKESSICGGIFDLPKKKERLCQIEDKTLEPSFWDDVQEAQKVIQESNDLKSWVLPLEDLLKRVEDVKSLAPDAKEEASFLKSSPKS